MLRERKHLTLVKAEGRILGLVIVAVMTAEVAIFLPSIARFRLVYLEQLIESGTLAALALDATPDNMVTEQVKGSLLAHARVEAVVLVEPNKPKRALMNMEPRPEMPGFNLKDRGALGLIWDALEAMVRDGSPYVRVGGESMRMPGAMVWIVVDERPMRAAMYGYTSRILILSIIIALFTASLLYLALRWLVIRPLQDLSRAMIDFRRAPEEPGADRAPVRRNDKIGEVGHGDGHPVAVSPRPHVDRCARGCVAHRVLEQVRHHLVHALRVTVGLEVRAFDHDVDRDVGRMQTGLTHRVGQHRFHRERLAFEGEGSRFQTREVEELGDETSQPLDLEQHCCEQFRLRFLDAVDEVLEPSLERGDRRAEFMAHVGHQVTPDPIGLAEFGGHAVERPGEFADLVVTPYPSDHRAVVAELELSSRKPASP